MKTRMIFKIYTSIILSLIYGLSFAQNNAKEYENFAEKYNTKEFKYVVEKPKKEAEPINTDWLDSFFRFLQNIEWTYVLYTILGLCFLLIIYKLYRNGMIFQLKSQHKANEYDEHFDYIENNLLSIDLVDLINKAKADKDYRLAIRYYHYQNAQNLAKNEYIVWDPKKTNQQLISQIKKENIKELFENNTQIFNQVWFGNFELNEENFSTFETNYKYLNQVI